MIPSLRNLVKSAESALLGVVVLSLPTPALTATSDPFSHCRALLVEALRPVSQEEVKALIEARNLSQEQILSGLDRELADRIFASQKREAIKRIDDLLSTWTLAVRENIKIRYDHIKKHNQEASARRELIKKGELTPQIDEPEAITFEYDADGVPRVPYAQTFRETALAILKNSTSKLGPAELEGLVVQAQIEGLKFGKDKNKVEIAKSFVRELIQVEMRRQLEAAIRKQSLRLERSLGAKNPDWFAVDKAARRVMQVLGAYLEENFPIDDALADQTRQATSAAEMLLNPVPITGPRAQVNSEGVAELVLPDHKVRAFYDNKLKTIVIEPLKGGLMPNKDGIVSILLHGDGTFKSRAASMEPQIQKLITMNLNPVATGQPNRVSIAMEVPGFAEAAALTEHEFREIQSRVKAEAERQGLPVPPIQAIGRSMGSTRLFAHSLLYDGADNPIAAYIGQSLSNPFTMDMQVEQVYKQLKDKTIRGVSPKSLDTAKDFAKTLLQGLIEVEKKDPDAFALFGDKQLYLQGLADEDGGPPVWRDLKLKLAKRFMPLAHVYPFKNPLPKVEGLEKFNPELQMGTHFLLNNKPNADPVEFKKFFLSKFGVQLTDRQVPMLVEQTYAVMATIAGFWDYLAESRSADPAMQTSQRVMAEFRERVAGAGAAWRKEPAAANAAPGLLGWFEYFNFTKLNGKKTYSELSLAMQFRFDNIANVRTFWKHEKRRVDAELRARGQLLE